MTTDNIFSDLKVVDFSSFIAGPGAAVILSDFGADVIKVEPPTGDLQRIISRFRRSRAQGQLSLASGQPQQARLGTRPQVARGKHRGPAARRMGRRDDRQHAAPGAEKAEAGVRGRRALEPAADLCRPHRVSATRARTRTCRDSTSPRFGPAADCSRSRAMPARRRRSRWRAAEIIRRRSASIPRSSPDFTAASAPARALM